MYSQESFIWCCRVFQTPGSQGPVFSAKILSFLWWSGSDSPHVTLPWEVHREHGVAVLWVPIVRVYICPQPLGVEWKLSILDISNGNWLLLGCKHVLCRWALLAEVFPFSWLRLCPPKGCALCPPIVSALLNLEHSKRGGHPGVLPKARDGGKHMAHCGMGWGGRKVLPTPAFGQAGPVGMGSGPWPQQGCQVYPRKTLGGQYGKLLTGRAGSWFLPPILLIRPWCLKARGSCVT